MAINFKKVCLFSFILGAYQNDIDNLSVGDESFGLEKPKG